MKLVTLLKTFSSAEAQLIRSRLEAAGFHAVVNHELSALSMEGYSLSTGGIHVQLPEDEIEEAQALLDASNDAEDEEAT